MLIIQNLSYKHPNKNLLFDNINLTVNKHDKVALIGNNGSGKSTLLKIIAKESYPLHGQVELVSEPYCVPQIFGQYNNLTVAQSLKVDKKLGALEKILAGDLTAESYEILGDDWTLEERCRQSLSYWQLDDVKLWQKMETLSGGEKTKVFLAGIFIHQPEFILLDEPSNHLDLLAREKLYSFIQTTKSTLLIVSHDRKLLNLLNFICEISVAGLKLYGGNYEFYIEQKKIEQNALDDDLQNSEKALRKAKVKERETLERQNKLDTRGKGKQEKAGVARIMMKTLKNKAEKSTAKIKGVHAEKIEGISVKLNELRSSVPTNDTMKFDFDNSSLRKGKMLFKASEINFKYNNRFLWQQNLSFEIVSGQRIHLKGLNGSGKTTLLKIILGELLQQTGDVVISNCRSVYIDQDYSLINNTLKVYEQAQQFNVSALQEHEVKVRLNRFLFRVEDWEKSCSVLSGGERMRLLLCCLSIYNQSPELIVLDEPTNNLDLQNIQILTAAIKEYEGTMIVVSHDQLFLNEINIEHTLSLK